MTPDNTQLLDEIKAILTWNAWILGIVGILVIIILVRLFCRVRDVSRWAPTYVDMASRHSEMTDNRFQRCEDRQQRIENRLKWMEEVMTQNKGRAAQLLLAGTLCFLFGGGP